MDQRKQKKYRQACLKVGKGRSYETISKNLDVPATTAANIIESLKFHGTVASLTSRGSKRKIDPRRNTKMKMQMVKKKKRAKDEG